MDLATFREYCLSLPHVTEEFPFGPETLVFKVGGKLFALTDVDNFESINVKCDPETAIDLRERYEDVIPGWHMNKKHWNTLVLDGSLSQKFFFEWTKHSYDVVVNSLSKKVKAELGG